MQKLIIKGKRYLSGKILISGSKNATLPILAACILSNKIKLQNIPLVKDIFTMIELLEFIGLKIRIFKMIRIRSSCSLPLPGEELKIKYNNIQ